MNKLELEQFAETVEARIQQLLQSYNPIGRTMTEDAWKALIDAHMLQGNRRTSRFQDSRVQHVHWALLVLDTAQKDIVFLARHNRSALHNALTRYLLENCTRAKKSRYLIVKSEFNRERK